MDDKMNRRPAFQFYPADWRKDPQLQMCDMNTQGIWINLLCCMWESNEEGKLVGTWDEFARLLGITVEEFKKFYIVARRIKFADVTNCNGEITIINRRMQSVFLEREDTKKRVRRHRAKDSNTNVTPYSSTSSSSSTSKNNSFAHFWEIYPRKTGKLKALESWNKINPDDQLLERIYFAVIEQSKSEQWRDPQYIPYPATWLNQGRWDDVPVESAKDKRDREIKEQMERIRNG